MHVGEPMSHPASVNAARFSPDGKTIVTACDDLKNPNSGIVRLWHAESAQPASEPFRVAAPVDDVRFTPDNRHIIIELSNREILTCCFTPALTLWAAEEQTVPPEALNPLRETFRQTKLLDPLTSWARQLLVDE